MGLCRIDAKYKELRETVSKMVALSKFQELKNLIARMIQSAGSGHYASSVSALEIMYPLFYEQGVKPDEFILSKGHAAPALYAILYDLGYIKDLSGFRQYGGLPGHPSLETNGVLCSSGSLGMGISKAMGLAIMNPDKVYHVLVGDGELQEGQNWEALINLVANHIENVIVHVDCNGHQYSGLAGSRGLAIISLLYTDEHQVLKPIRIHLTNWEHDNKYLTKPQPPKTQYSEHLLKLMSENEKIIVLDADLIDDFGLRVIQDRHPERFIECGISEQCMVSMANGIALSGYYPICHTFSAFYKRCVDQIYNNYCDKLPVVYVAGLCGRPSLNIGESHLSTPGKDLLGWMPEILVTQDMYILPYYIGQKTIYLELGA